MSGVHDANLNSGLYTYNTSIVFKRRGSTGRPDHITDIILVSKSFGRIPEGYHVLSKTVSFKHEASLSRGTYGRTLYLCFKRNSNWDGDSQLYNTEATISSIVVVNETKGELPPANAIMSPKNINRGTLSGHNILIGIVKEHPTGLCDIPYESFTIDRYPSTDYDDFKLPVNELPMFVFPHGLPLQRRPHTNAPMPSFFPFVFTGQSGERIHVVCLTFYEELPSAVVNKLKLRHSRIHASFSEEIEDLRGGATTSSTSTEKKNGTNDSAMAATSNYGIYAPKCICIISRFPFYRALRRFLRQLYRLSLSAAPAPLERYISYLVTFIPVPKPGGRPFNVHLESPTLSNVMSSGRGGGYSLAPISLQLPPSRSLPPMDLDFNAPFRSLSVINVLNIFSILLKESQLLFLSSSASLVTEVCETFRLVQFVRLARFALLEFETDIRSPPPRLPPGCL